MKIVEIELKPEEQQLLADLLLSIRNRCDIALHLLTFLSTHSEIRVWLPTVLEDLAVDSQTIVDDYCVVKDA